MTSSVRVLSIAAAIIVLAMVGVPSAFADAAIVDFSAIGLVYNDLNCDGAYSATAMSMDTAMDGIAFRAYSDNAPFGVFGAEDALVSESETDAEGYAVVHTTTAGEYLLVIDKPLGFLATTPEVQSVSVEESSGPALAMRTFGLTLRQNMPVRSFFPLLGR